MAQSWRFSNSGLTRQPGATAGQESNSKMSHVEPCPKCGAFCKTSVDAEGGEVRYKALQDADAFKKIEQLKKLIDKRGGPPARPE